MSLQPSTISFVIYAKSNQADVTFHELRALLADLKQELYLIQHGPSQVIDLINNSTIWFKVNSVLWPIRQ